MSLRALSQIFFDTFNQVAYLGRKEISEHDVVPEAPYHSRCREVFNLEGGAQAVRTQEGPRTTFRLDSDEMSAVIEVSRWNPEPIVRFENGHGDEEALTTVASRIAAMTMQTIRPLVPVPQVAP